MTDAAMRQILPTMSGDGVIIELGAGGDYYKRYMEPEQKYLTSNLYSGCDLQLDMTRLELDDNSVDGLVSVFALEHLYNFESVFKEMQRVLKPGGRMAIIAPFMYYYHAAPEDFFRFTQSAMNRLLASTTILRCQPLGNKSLLIAELLHEKTIMGSRLGFFSRLLLRLIALPFLVMGLRSHDSRYSFGYAYLAEKTQ
jgi:SAM-dependent methyltransferase